MMTNSEAIKWLNEAEILDLTSGNTKDRQAVDAAIEALGKQIPKKPNYYKEEDIFVKDLFFVYTYCPVCEKEIVMDDMYCGCCGQAIDWEEE